jgi:hypothetical protein
VRARIANVTGTFTLGQGVQVWMTPFVTGGSNTVNVANTASQNLAQVSGATINLGQTTMVSSLPVAIASDQSALALNLSAVGGSAVALGAKTASASVPVVIASNQSPVPTYQLSTVGTTSSTAVAQATTTILAANATLEGRDGLQRFGHARARQTWVWVHDDRFHGGASGHHDERRRVLRSARGVYRHHHRVPRCRGHRQLARNGADLVPLNNPVRPTYAQVVTGTALAATGLTGASTTARLVGGNASGAPASGTWVAGDTVVNQDGTLFTYNGTAWAQLGSGGAGAPRASR